MVGHEDEKIRWRPDHETVAAPSYAYCLNRRCGCWIIAAISVADIYVPTDIEKKPQTSFKAARSLSDKLAEDAIGLTQKYAGASYSPNEVSDIKNRIWDKTQVTMLQFYRPSEKE